MDFYSDGAQILLVLKTGDQLLAALREVTTSLRLRAAIITSGVGMLSDVRLGFFCDSKDDYEITAKCGILDINTIVGNIVEKDGAAWPHVHMTFNDREHRCFGGHIMEATCHITMEVALTRLDSVDLAREKVSGFPATRIVPKKR